VFEMVGYTSGFGERKNADVVHQFFVGKENISSLPS